MRHRPDFEQGYAPIWALCPSGTAARSRAPRRSCSCPAQVTHPRRRQVANFRQIISRQLRRLTGSRADSVSSCRGHHPRQPPLRPPQSLPVQHATSSWPAPVANLSTVSGATRACGVPGGEGHLPDPRLLAWDHWAASARPRTPDSTLKVRTAPSPRGVLAHRRPRGAFRFRRPQSAGCQLRAPSAMSLGPPRGPLPQTRSRLPRAPSSSF